MYFLSNELHQKITFLNRSNNLYFLKNSLFIILWRFYSKLNFYFIKECLKSFIYTKENQISVKTWKSGFEEMHFFQKSS